MPADKAKEERLAEGLELLRALLRTGVGEDELAYLDMKTNFRIGEDRCVMGRPY